MTKVMNYLIEGKTMKEVLLPPGGVYKQMGAFLRA